MCIIFLRVFAAARVRSLGGEHTDAEDDDEDEEGVEHRQDRRRHLRQTINNSNNNNNSSNNNTNNNNEDEKALSVGIPDAMTCSWKHKPPRGNRGRAFALLRSSCQPEAGFRVSRLASESQGWLPSLKVGLRVSRARAPAPWRYARQLRSSEAPAPRSGAGAERSEELRSEERSCEERSEELRSSSAPGRLPSSELTE